MILFALIIISLIMLIFVIAFFIADGTIAKIQIMISFNTIVILFIMLYLVYTGQAKYLDIALMYALLGFAGTLAISKYLQYHLTINKENK